METLNFAIANWSQILARGWEHISLVGVAVSVAVLTGVPIGILITQSRTAADRVLYIAAVIMTIPSIAFFTRSIDNSTWRA